jgi:hypothetical protein
VIELSAFLFEFTDDYGNQWAGRRFGYEVWLLRYQKAHDKWVTVRAISGQELEEYQRISGIYSRA